MLIRRSDVSITSFCDVHMTAYCKWTDLQSTAIWLGMLMGMLGAANCSHNLCQIRSSLFSSLPCQIWYWFITMGSVDPWRSQDNLNNSDNSETWHTRQGTRQMTGLSFLCSSSRFGWKVGQSNPAGGSQEAGPLFQDLTSGCKQPESDNKTPSRQKQVYNRRTVRTVLSPTMTTTVGQSGPCLLGTVLCTPHH